MDSRLLLGIVVWLALVSLAFAARKKEQSSFPKAKAVVDEEAAAKRLQSLEEKLRGSSVISLSDRNFTKFVVDRPRDYHAVLMFTATDPRYQCGVCLKVKNSFEEVAKMYNEQYNFNDTQTNEKIVFFRLEVDDARSIFNELGLETVPRMYALPPLTAGAAKLDMHKLEFDSRPFMESIQSALNHINDNIGIKIRVLYDPLPILLGVGILALFLALFVSAASYDLGKTFLFYQSPKIWVVISLICFAVGVSGSIYCIIRSAPPFGYTRQGTLSIFAAQGREQFLLEGIIVALWTVGCGLALFFTVQASKLRFPLVRHVLVLLGITFFAVLALQIWGAYTTKTAWYSLRETIPAELWQFLRSSVKKDSGLAKRLLRASEIWLVESKDFASFRKKFDLLIVEYLKRIIQSKINA